MTASSPISACHYPTPVGDLTVLSRLQKPTDTVSQGRGSTYGDTGASGSGDLAVVVAAGFCSADDLWERLPKPDQTTVRVVKHLGDLQAPIVAYLDGDLSAFDELPIAQAGTDLQQQVWQGLRSIPVGQTRTYSELARNTDKPKAVRAVGSACGRNLVAPMVPCHRALRSDGTLGGYYYGLKVKQWLLEHEQATEPALFS